MKTILFNTKLCLIITIILSITASGKATHITGMDLSYKSLGNHQYEVFLSSYRDCNGSKIPKFPIIKWDGSCGSGSTSLNQINTTDVSPYCSSISTNLCESGNATYRMEKYTHSGILTLPANCTNVIISYEGKYRNASISSLHSSIGEKIYIEAFLENSNLINNSPVFGNNPYPFGCINQPLNLNYGAVDEDGDEIRYSLTDCKNTDGITVNYRTGFSFTDPISTTQGIFIDSLTGAIQFIPTTIQTGVICILVEEFRDGIKIGSIVRDMQFNIHNCSNTLPTITGMDSTKKYTASIEAGNELCFDIFANDADLGQNINISWNAAIPNAQFFSSSVNGMATFCWQTNTSDSGIYTFTVSVNDDNCPLMGQNTFTYTIAVIKPTNCDTIELDITAVQDIRCKSNDGRVLLTASGGTAPYNYQIINWSDGQMYENFDGLFENLNKGTYGIWIDDTDGCSPVIDTFFVIGGTADSLNLSSTNTQPKCVGSHNGSILTHNSGSAIPYLFTIDGIHFQTSNYFPDLSEGNYVVTVIDTSGCSDSIKIVLEDPNPVEVQVTTTASACMQPTGSINLTAQGGSGIYHFAFQGQQHAPQSLFNDLSAGIYHFEIIDANKCRIDTSIIVQQTPAFDIGMKKYDMPCFDRCEGVAKVSVPSNIVGATYRWSTGDTGSEIDLLCNNLYAVTVTDVQGCSVESSISIERPHKIKTFIQSTKDESCQLNDGEAVILVNGGVSPYSFEVFNQINNHSHSNTDGIFDKLSAGTHHVIIEDANFCVVQGIIFNIDGCQPIMLNQSKIENSTFGLNIIPNPASTYIDISWKKQSSPINLQISDIYGRVYQQHIIENDNQIQLSVENLNSGSYFINIKSADGEPKDNQKLIIL